MSDEQITAEATPAGELRRQILSQCVAKNEREWWAAGTIEKLEFELNAANRRISWLEEAVQDSIDACERDIGILEQRMNNMKTAKEAKP